MATAALNIYSNRLTLGLRFQQLLLRSDRLSRLAHKRQLVNAVFWAAVAIVTLAVGMVALLHGVHILKNAGVIPTTGAISGLTNLVTSVMNSIKWFAATMIGVSLCVIAAMFIMGHQNAHSHGMRIGFGVIALVCVPGLIA